MRVSKLFQGLIFLSAFEVLPTALAQDVEWQVSQGDVGVGTGSPQAKLHVQGASGTKLLVENTDADAVGDQFMFSLTNASNSKARFAITSGGKTWTFSAAPGGDIFEVSKVGTGVSEFRVDASGNITARGVSYAINHVNTSSRATKQDFGYIDTEQVLSKLVGLPIMRWRFRDEIGGSRHLGPVSEDFQNAFDLGDGRTISTIDASGVALAAIQGLKREKDRDIGKLEAENARLEALLYKTEARYGERIKQLELALNRLMEGEYNAPTEPSEK